MMKSEEGADVEVTWADQKMINEFSRCNNRLGFLNDELKQKKDEAAKWEDASQELFLAPEGDIRYMIGECFVNVTFDDAEARLEIRKSELEEEVAELESNIEGLKNRMAELKVELKAKFKDSINLDEE